MKTPGRLKDIQRVKALLDAQAPVPQWEVALIVAVADEYRLHLLYRRTPGDNMQQRAEEQSRKTHRQSEHCRRLRDEATGR